MIPYFRAAWKASCCMQCQWKTNPTQSSWVLNKASTCRKKWLNMSPRPWEGVHSIMSWHCSPGWHQGNSSTQGTWYTTLWLLLMLSFHDEMLFSWAKQHTWASAFLLPTFSLCVCSCSQRALERAARSPLRAKLENLNGVCSEADPCGFSAGSGKTDLGISWSKHLIA